MLKQILNSFANTFIGDPVSETEEIYRSKNRKQIVHLGLFRKADSKIVWFKFRASGSSIGFAIKVKNFGNFAEFVAGAVDAANEEPVEGDRKFPFIARIFFGLPEGVLDPRYLGEYQAEPPDKDRLRLHSFTNRRGARRVLLDIGNATGSSLQTVDFDFLPVLALEIVRRAAGGSSV